MAHKELPIANISARYFFARQLVTWGLESNRVRWTTQPEKEYEPRFYDYADIRNRFLSIPEGDTDALLQFLNWSGVWESHERELPLKHFWDDQETMRFLLAEPGYEEFQRGRIPQIYRSLLTSLSIWSIRCEPKEPPILEMVFSGVRNAIYVSIWLDLSRKAAFRYCLRRDCPEHSPAGVPFEVSRSDQVYCSQYCAHVESQRKNRAERSAKSRSKKPQTKRGAR